MSRWFQAFHAPASDLSPRGCCVLGLSGCEPRSQYGQSESVMGRSYLRRTSLNHFHCNSSSYCGLCNLNVSQSAVRSRGGLYCDFFGEPPELMWSQRLFFGIWTGGESWRGGWCLGGCRRSRAWRTLWFATRCFSGRLGWLRARLLGVGRWRMQRSRARCAVVDWVTRHLA